MWIFIPEGFFGRARSDDDLDRLRASYFPNLGENVHLPGRDYPVRAFTTHEGLAGCLSKIAMGIDYDNFKNAVAARHSSERAHVYANVWSDCRKIEHGKGSEE
jgi:hypothetical protein